MSKKQKKPKRTLLFMFRPHEILSSTPPSWMHGGSPTYYTGERHKHQRMNWRARIPTNGGFRDRLFRRMHYLLTFSPPNVQKQWENARIVQERKSIRRGQANRINQRLENFKNASKTNAL